MNESMNSAGKLVKELGLMLDRVDQLPLGLTLLAFVAAFNISAHLTGLSTVVELLHEQRILTDRVLGVALLSALGFFIYASVAAPILRVFTEAALARVVFWDRLSWLFDTGTWTRTELNYSAGFVGESELEQHGYSTQDQVAISVLDRHRQYVRQRQDERELLARRSFTCVSLWFLDLLILKHSSILASIVSLAHDRLSTTLVALCLIGASIPVVRPWWREFRYALDRQLRDSRVYFPQLARKLRKDQ